MFSLQWRHPLGAALLFLVTTSSCRDWVICAPAAFLRSGSRFSGSLSEIIPSDFVTRYNHGSHINYHRKLIRQTLERYSTAARACASLSYSESTLSNKCTYDVKNVRLDACISSRITAVIQVHYGDLRKYGCCNELFAASLDFRACLHVHGLIFETSI